MSVTVQAFLLCDSVERIQGKATMLAMYDILLASRFPATRKCSIFCRLYAADQRDHGVALLMETPTQTTRELMAHRKFVPKPNGIIQLTCNVGRLQFTHEGVHILKLLIDRQPRSEFHLTVSYRNVAGKAAIADRNYGFTIERPSTKPRE
jgi:hypothetical protein